MTKAAFSYEETRERLVEVVRQLESGTVPLTQAMELWQEGERLAATCQQWLDGARASVDQARDAGPAPDGQAPPG